MEIGINNLLQSKPIIFSLPSMTKHICAGLKCTNDVHRTSQEMNQVENSNHNLVYVFYTCIQELKIIFSTIVPKILMLKQILDGKFKMRVFILLSLAYFKLSKRYNII